MGCSQTNRLCMGPDHTCRCFDSRSDVLFALLSGTKIAPPEMPTSSFEMNYRMGSSLLGLVKRKRRVRSDAWNRVLHSAGALPETYYVSFGVLEVGCEAHVSNWLFLSDHLAT